MNSPRSILGQGSSSEKPLQGASQGKTDRDNYKGFSKTTRSAKNDIGQLKAQMGQILEILESMSNQGALEQLRATPHHVTSNQTSHQGPYYGNSGTQIITGFDVVDLFSFPGIGIPPDFELPTFNNYRGTSCPKSHLTMYCRKMTPHTHDDTLLIHFFQESLTRAALRWYLGLRREHIPTWKSLAKGFLNQYKYNMDMAPDRSQLQSMAKGEKEAFKEYARRWRELATPI
ncbi:hypothetical protein CR513_02904, partial [Mucuna pruriens]